MMGNSNDEEFVIASVQATLDAYNRGDVDEFLQHFTDEANGFTNDGSVLFDQYNEEFIRDLYRAGLEPNLRFQHLQAKVFGDSAVITGYFVGRTIFRKDKCFTGAWRFSEFRIREDDRWKVVHYHMSALSPDPELTL